jgi:hypothetical protein
MALPKILTDTLADGADINLGPSQVNDWTDSLLDVLGLDKTTSYTEVQMLNREADAGVEGGFPALDADALVPLANLPDVLTGKDADTLDGSHALVEAPAVADPPDEVGAIPVTDPTTGFIDVAYLKMGHTTDNSGIDADAVDDYHATKTPAANCIPVAGADGVVDPGFLGASPTPAPNVLVMAGSGLLGTIDNGFIDTATLVPENAVNADTVDDAHASATPTASTIPIADANNKLANGWLKTGTGNGIDADKVDGAHAAAVSGGASGIIPISGAGGKLDSSFLPSAATMCVKASKPLSSDEVKLDVGPNAIGGMGIDLPTEDYDPNSMHSGTDGFFTVPTGGGGKWAVSAGVAVYLMAGVSATVHLEIRVNSAALDPPISVAVYNASWPTLAKATSQRLAVTGDVVVADGQTISIYLSMRAFASGTTASFHSAWLSAHRITA